MNIIEMRKRLSSFLEGGSVESPLVPKGLPERRRTIAMDGEDGLNGIVNLAVHDRRFHPNGYHPGDRCKLREQLRRVRDNYEGIDTLNPGGMHNLESSAGFAGFFNDMRGILSLAETQGLINGDEKTQIMNSLGTLSSCPDENDDALMEAWGTRVGDTLSILSMLKEATGFVPQRNANENANNPQTPYAENNGTETHENNGDNNDRVTFATVPPVRRLVGDYAQRLVNSLNSSSLPRRVASMLPERYLINGVGEVDRGQVVRDLLENPQNPEFRDVLEGINSYALGHQTSWSARFMGVINRTHPNWHQQSVEASRNIAEANPQPPPAPEPSEGETPNEEARRFLHGTPEEVDNSVSRRGFNDNMYEAYNLFRRLQQENGTQDSINKTRENSRYCHDFNGNLSTPEWSASSIEPYAGGMSLGCNCWKTVASTIARIRGFKVEARSENADLPKVSMFSKSQEAMSKNYEKMPIGREAVLDKLNKMLNGDRANGIKAYPDGTCIAMWSGSHCTLAVKVGMTFHFIDPFRSSTIFSDKDMRFLSGRCSGGSSREEEVSGELREALEYNNAPRGSARAEEWRQWREGIAANRTGIPEFAYVMKSMLGLYARTKIAMMHEGNPNPTEEEVKARTIRELIDENSEWNKMNGSYIIRPDQPLIPEMFGLMGKSSR